MSQAIKANAIRAVREVEAEATKLAKGMVTEINSIEDLVGAQNQLKEVGQIRERIKEKKESITKPLNVALKNIRDLFRPAEDKLDTMDEHLKGQILSYYEMLQAEKVAREKLAEYMIAQGESLKKATAPVAEVNKQMEVIKTRRRTKVVITDESKLPREYLIPDMQKIKEALTSGQKVDGAEIKEEEIIVR